MTTDEHAVRGYLADRDLACPNCGYNLRGVGTARCPECAMTLELTLSVGGRDPRMVGLAAGTLAVWILVYLASGVSWFSVWSEIVAFEPLLAWGSLGLHLAGIGIVLGGLTAVAARASRPDAGRRAARGALWACGALGLITLLQAVLSLTSPW